MLSGNNRSLRTTATLIFTIMKKYLRNCVEQMRNFVFTPKPLTTAVLCLYIEAKIGVRSLGSLGSFKCLAQAPYYGV